MRRWIKLQRSQAQNLQELRWESIDVFVERYSNLVLPGMGEYMQMKKDVNQAIDLPYPIQITIGINLRAKGQFHMLTNHPVI